MANYCNELSDDTCWVYVHQDDAKNYIIAITYNKEFMQREEFKERPLLLWRKFEDTLSAAGYRMVLKGLSTESLEEVIKRYNETVKNRNEID